MKIDRKKLIGNLLQVVPGVENGASILEGADTIVFTKDGIYSYNDNIAVSVPEVIGITGAIKAKELYTFLQKLKGEEVVLKQMKTQLIIKCGRTTAKLKIVDTSILKYLKNLKIGKLTWKKIGPDFMKFVRLCKLSASSSPYRGLYVNDDTICSTDSVRIATATVKGAYDPFWLDDTIVGEILKVRDEFKEIAVATGWVHFKTADGAVFSCKTNDVAIYPYESLRKIQKSAVKKKGDIECVLPASFKEAVDRVSILAEDISGWSAINLTLSSTDITISSKKSTGEITETIDWEKEIDIEGELQTAGDAGFLIEAAEKSLKFYITKSKYKKIFLVFKTGKFSLFFSAIEYA